jgi:hypothetical protein
MHPYKGCFAPQQQLPMDSEREGRDQVFKLIVGVRARGLSYTRGLTHTAR